MTQSFARTPTTAAPLRTASIAYSTCNRWPSGLKTVMDLRAGGTAWTGCVGDGDRLVNNAGTTRTRPAAIQRSAAQRAKSAVSARERARRSGSAQPRKLGSREAAILAPSATGRLHSVLAWRDGLCSSRGHEDRRHRVCHCRNVASGHRAPSPAVVGTRTQRVAACPPTYRSATWWTPAGLRGRCISNHGGSAPASASACTTGPLLPSPAHSQAMMEDDSVVGVDPRVGVTLHGSDNSSVVLSVPAACRSDVRATP